MRELVQQYGAAGKRLARVVIRLLARSELVWDTWERVRNAQRLLGYVREARHVPEGSVVFLGSSSVVRFPLAQIFKGGTALCRGLGAETIADTIARLRWTLPVARPSGVIVWAGANDLRSLAADPLVVVARLAGLLDAIQMRVPEVPMALLGVPPWCDQTEADLERLSRLNEGLRSLSFARNIPFIDVCRPPLTEDDGRLALPMAGADRKHLGFAGYEQVARWIVKEGGEAAEALEIVASVHRVAPASMFPPPE